MLPTINTIPLVFTLLTAFGVMVHDTKIDSATSLALTAPIALVTYASVDALMKSGDSHVHVEKISGPKQLSNLKVTTPRIQPRDDDRRYIQTKKVFFGGSDNVSLWPSV